MCVIKLLINTGIDITTAMPQCLLCLKNNIRLIISASPPKRIINAGVFSTPVSHARNGTKNIPIIVAINAINKLKRISIVFIFV